MGRASRPRKRRDALGGSLGKCEPDRGCCWTHARRKSGDFAGTSPRADGAASGSSSSPDENVSARSNPPSPRDRSPRSRSPRPPSPSDEDDPHRARAALDALARGAAIRHPASVRAKTTRRARREAAQTRRHDGQTLGGAHGTRGVPAGSVGSAESDDTHDGDDDAVDRPWSSAEPRRTVTPFARHGAGRASTRATREPRGLPRRETAARGRGRRQPDAHRRERVRLRRLGRPPRDARRGASRRPPPNKSKTRERSRAPRHSRRRPPRRRGPRCLPLFRNLPREGPRGRRGIRQFPKRRRKRRRRRRRRKTSSTSSPSLPFRTRALRIETPSSRPSSRDDESIFGTPAGETPNASAVVGEGLARSPLGARRPAPASSGSIATSRSNPRRRPRRRRRRSRRLARRTRHRSVAFSRLTI